MEEKDKTMYFGAKPVIFERARKLRNKMTHAELVLWERLCKKQICNKRFRRQHPIEMFIVDFYCHEARLAVEVDGEIHNTKREYDEGRTAEMARYFIKVIRFTNKEIEENTDKVVKEIEAEVLSRITSPPWGI